MNKFRYAMPNQGYGKAGINITMRLKPAVLGALRAHVTKDPETGKGVSIAILVHQLVDPNADPALIDSIQQTFMKLSEEEDGRNSRER